MVKPINIKYFRDSKSHNKTNFKSLKKAEFIQKNNTLRNILKEIFEGNCTFNNEFLKNIALYSKTYHTKMGEKFTPNGNNGIHLYYLLNLIKNNYNQISSDSLVIKFENLNKQINKLIVIALLRKDPILIKFLINDKLPSLKTKSESELNKIVSEVIINSINPQGAIYIFKELLTHLQTCISADKFSPHIPNRETLLEIAHNSLIEGNSINRVKQNKISFESSKNKLIASIDALFTSYNELLKEYFIASDSDKLFVFKGLFSVLYSNRGFYGYSKVTLDVYNNVIKSIKGGDLMPLESSLLDKFLPNLKEIVERLLSKIETQKITEEDFSQSEYLHISSSAGPNGSPSLFTLPLDAKALINAPELMDSIITLGNWFGIKGIRKAIVDMSSTPFPEQEKENPLYKSVKNPVHSKLFIFSEPGGKWRIVAEVDGFTQTVLSPIHTLLSKISASLGNLSGHYDQTESFMNAYNQSQITGFLGTFDLTNATDYLYTTISKKIISEICKQSLGLENVGDIWEKVISSNRNFVVNNFEHLESVCYKFGQPMGAKSSWVSLHITLLVLVMQAEINALAKNPDTNRDHFSITGDDMIITDSEVYTELEIIMRALNLQINENKSFKSYHKNTPKYVFGEYLKKIIYMGEVIVPFSGRTGGRFFHQPKQQLFNYFKFLLFLGLDFNGMDLLNYTYIKDSKFFSREIENEETESDPVPNMISYFEQLYYWCLVTHEMGGLNYPIESFDKIFRNSPVYELVKQLNQHLSPSLNIESKIVQNRIKDAHFRALKRSDTAILTVFNKTGLLAINNSLTKQNIRGEKANLIWEEVESNLKEELVKQMLSSYPIFKIIITICAVQKSELITFISNQNEQLESISKDGIVSNYTERDLNELYSMLKLARKKTQLIDIYTITAPDLDSDESELNPISKRQLLLYKSIGHQEAKLISEKMISSTADNIFS